MTLNRRQFLTRSGLGVAGAAAGAVTGLALPARGAIDADASAPSPVDGGPSAPNGPTLGPVAFHGPHQAGILDAAQACAIFATFDVVTSSRTELADVMKTLTSRARWLTSGGIPANLAVSVPPSDSGTLGPIVPPDGLTITTAVSSTLFDDDRFGLGAVRPARLKPMLAFPNDDLDPAWLGGDLLLQIGGGEPDVVAHALRDLAKHTRGALALRWKINGFVSPARPDGRGRNHLGFKDGIANPAVDETSVADQLLWVLGRGDEPAWTKGGSYQVCRLIRTYIEFWDRVSLSEQQGMFGRFRDTGIVLGSSNPDAYPDYADDPHGRVIPLTSHIRLANPRTPATEPSQIYRRSFNYDLGVDLNGNLDVGSVFNCFQQDLVRQFEVVQGRLLNEALADYIAPFGGGYFFALPGVIDNDDWYLRGALTA